MRTKIIADITSNHMGDMAIAESLIKAASEAGVDIVKFQSWQANKLRKDFPDYKYKFQYYQKTQLSDKEHIKLIELCNKYKVGFLTTCFDLDRIEFLASLGIDTIKVGSPDCTSFRLLEKLMKHFPHLIISTGMSTDKDVESMVNFVKGHKATILHCVSIYPTPLDKINLARMKWLQSFGFPVGFSDHSLGTEASKLAIATGAIMIEKHITLSRSLPGKDQEMSTLPSEFKEIVEWAKQVEIMGGIPHPKLSAGEKKLRRIYIGKWGNNK